MYQLNVEPLKLLVATKVGVPHWLNVVPLPLGAAGTGLTVTAITGDVIEQLAVFVILK